MAQRAPQVELQWLDEFLVDATSNQSREPRRRRKTRPPSSPASLRAPASADDAANNGAKPEAAASPEMADDAPDRRESKRERDDSESESADLDGQGEEQQEQEACCRQLQADLDVLAVHVDAEAQARAAEREAAAAELRAARVESEALRRENARLVQQGEAAAHRQVAAAESHEQLLRALTEQQRQHELQQASNHVLARDGAAAKRSLEAAQLACRRLEEELAAAHAQLLQLQGERQALEAALGVAAHRRAGSEAAQLRMQDEVIRSLRADLLQMEFECQTLRVDKDALEDKLARLERRRGVGTAGKAAAASTSTSRAGCDYDVVPLDKAEPATGKKRATIRPLKARGQDARGSMFGSLLDLPNFVGERPEADGGGGSHDHNHSSHGQSRRLPRAYEAEAPHGHGRHAPGIVSRMATTVKKRFGAPAGEPKPPQH